MSRYAISPGRLRSTMLSWTLVRAVSRSRMSLWQVSDLECSLKPKLDVLPFFPQSPFLLLRVFASSPRGFLCFPGSEVMNDVS